MTDLSFLPDQPLSGLREDVATTTPLIQQNDLSFLPDKPSFVQKAFVKPIKTLAGGFQSAAADTAKTLDFYTKKIGNALGIPETKNGIFKILSENWEYWGKKLTEEGLSEGVAKEIYSGLGRAGFDVPVIMAAAPTLKAATLPAAGAVKGYEQGGGKGAAVGAVGGALFSGALRGLNVLPSVVRPAAGAAVFGATTPGGIKEKTAGAVLGAVLSSRGPKVSKAEFKETMKYLPGAGRGEGLYASLINRFQPIENIIAKAKALGADIKPGEDAGIRARGYLGMGGKVKATLENQTYKITPEGKIKITGEGLKPILKSYDRISPEKNVKVREQNLNDYLIAKRTVADLQRPKYEGSTENIVTPKQVNQAQIKLEQLSQKYGNLSHFESTAKRLYEYQQRILHLLVDSGNLSPGQYNQIISANPNYIPFTRIMEGIEPGGVIPISKNRFTGARAPIKRIKGSELAIENPMESVVKNTYRIMDVAERNTIAKNVAKLSGVLPDEIQPVKIQMRPIRIDPTEVDTIKKEFISRSRQVLRKTKRTGGIVTDEQAPSSMDDVKRIVTESLQRRGMTEGEANQYLKMIEANAARRGVSPAGTTQTITETINNIIKETVRVIEQPIESTIFRPSPFKPTGNVIEYFIDGKRKYVELTPNLYQAMSGLNETSVSMFTQIMSKPASWLRRGATITPEFMFRNPIRDQFTALLQTKLGFKPFLDPVKAYADLIGKSDVYYDWLRSGGSYSGFVELSRPQLQKTVTELTRNPALLKQLNIITKAGDISQFFEQATRLGVYKQAVAKGLTPVEAGFQARESTVDFGRKGAKTKDVNAVIAFFNANVQGLDKSIRSAKNDPVGFTAKGIAAITIPSILLYLKNRKDPDYQEIPQWQRDIFWVTKFGDTYVRIPKPFLYGQIFGSLPERFMAYLDTKDPDAFKDIAKTVIGAASPLGGEEDPVSGVLPTAIKPLVENTANWNFFMGRNIVPKVRQELLPELQYGKYASETAKILGEMINYPPAKIENLVRGWFGGTGGYALEGADGVLKLFRKMRQIPSEGKRPTEWADIPLIKGFVTRPPQSYPESLNRFYENLDKVGKAYRSYISLMKEEKNDQADNILKRYPTLDYSPAFNSYAAIFSDLTNEIDRIAKSTDYTMQEKRIEIMDLELQRMEMAQEANKLLKNQL